MPKVQIAKSTCDKLRETDYNRIMDLLKLLDLIRNRYFTKPKRSIIIRKPSLLSGCEGQG